MEFMNLYDWLNLVGLKRLELCDAKVSRTVLRGGSHSNVASLPDRKEGDSIYVGDDITIKILSIRHRHMRIGITAPESLQILRDNTKNKTRDLTSQVPIGLLTRNVRKNEL